MMHSCRDVLDLRLLREPAQEHLLTDGSTDRFRHRPGGAPNVFSGHFPTKIAIPAGKGRSDVHRDKQHSGVDSNTCCEKA